MMNADFFLSFFGMENEARRTSAAGSGGGGGERRRRWLGFGGWLGFLPPGPDLGL